MMFVSSARRVAVVASVSFAVLALSGCGGGGGSSPSPPTNAAPQFTAAATGSVAENAVAATVLTLAASDANGDTITFAITGGADAGFFRISDNQLQLAPSLALNYDIFGDANRDNVYLVTVTASDGRGGSTAQTINVTLTNDREGIRVTRILDGFGEVAGMAATGLSSRELVVGMRNGTYVRFEGSRAAGDARPAVQDFFSTAAPGRVLLDIGWGTDSAPSVYRGLFGLVGSSTEVRLERSPQSSFASGSLAFGNGLLVKGALFYTPTGEFLAALGYPSGQFAQGAFPPGENGFGKLFRIEPSGGASVNFVSGNPIGRGIQAPGGFAMLGDRVALADQGSQSEHEFSLFLESDRQMNFGWPFFEGSVARQAGAPSPLLAPAVTYPFGNGRFEGGGIVMGALYAGTIPGLTGQLVFGDTSGAVWSIPIAFQFGAPTAAGLRELRTDDFAPDAGRIDGLVKILADSTGVLYLLDRDGEVFRVDPS